MSTRSVPAALAICLLSLLRVTTAHAWTDASITSARVQVEVAPDGAATVAMSLRLRVHRGWLEGLEISDLDPDLSLSELKPPWVVEAGEGRRKYHPAVRVLAGGRVSFTFHGRGRSPRRGLYLIGLVYATHLSPRPAVSGDDGRVHLSWTLPGWRTGLDGVEIALSAPAGASAATRSAPGMQSGIEVSASRCADRTILQWRRAHLARTIPWTVEVTLPRRAVGPSLSAPGRRPAPPPRPARAGGASRPPPVAALALALAALALLRRYSFDRSLRSRGARARPLLPGPMLLRLPAAVGFAAGAILLSGPYPALSLGLLVSTVILGLDITPRIDATTPRLGVFRRLTKDDLGSARRARLLSVLGAETVFDVTTPIGALVLIGLATCLAELPPLKVAGGPDLLTCLGLLLPTFLTGTRFHLPASPRLRLQHLLDLVASLRVPRRGPAFALRAELRVDARGAWQDARACIALPRFSADLGRLHLAHAETETLGGICRRPVLVGVARSGSPPAQALLRLDEEAETRVTAGWVARVFRLDAGPSVGDRLAELLCRLESACEAMTTPQTGTEARSPATDPVASRAAA